jgi:hypothetical protein
VSLKKERKEVSPMEKRYETPELTMIGTADEIVMGQAGSGLDFPFQVTLDFEFEQD